MAYTFSTKRAADKFFWKKNTTLVLSRLADELGQAAYDTDTVYMKEYVASLSMYYLGKMFYWEVFVFDKEYSHVIRFCETVGSLDYLFIAISDLECY